MTPQVTFVRRPYSHAQHGVTDILLLNSSMGPGNPNTDPDA